MKSIKNLFLRLRKRSKNGKNGGKNKPEFRDVFEKWIAQHYGEDLVAEALNMYDTLNDGGVIGDFRVTAGFLELLATIKKDTGYS